MDSKLANISNYLAASMLFITGMIYLLKDGFMPYHSEAISLEWNEVDDSTQFLILALMRSVAGGYICVTFVIVFLQTKFAATK
jgi:hypothetical protein